MSGWEIDQWFDAEPDQNYNSKFVWLKSKLVVSRAFLFPSSWTSRTALRSPRAASSAVTGARARDAGPSIPAARGGGLSRARGAPRARRTFARPRSAQGGARRPGGAGEAGEAGGRRAGGWRDARSVPRRRPLEPALPPRVPAPLRDAVWGMAGVGWRAHSGVLMSAMLAMAYWRERASEARSGTASHPPGWCQGPDGGLALRPQVPGRGRRVETATPVLHDPAGRGRFPRAERYLLRLRWVNCRSGRGRWTPRSRCRSSAVRICPTCTNTPR